MSKRKAQSTSQSKAKQPRYEVEATRLLLLREECISDAKLDQLRAQSQKMLQWKCTNCTKEFELRFCDRTRGQRDCPHCVPPDGQFAHLYPPNILKQWMTEKNEFRLGDVLPQGGTHVHGWFRCEKSTCEHEWKTYLRHRLNGSGCPACANRAGSKYNNCITWHPELLLEWDFAKNDKPPEHYARASGYKAWFICLKCKYGWQNTIVNRTTRKQGCPQCAGQIATDTENFAVKHPDQVQWLHPTKNKYDPYKVRPQSNKQTWWLCKNGHETYISFQVRAKGHECTYCAGNKACRETSVGSLHPHLVAEWHRTNENSIYDYRPGSMFVARWKCLSCGFIYRRSIVNRVKGSSCSICRPTGHERSLHFGITHPHVFQLLHPSRNDGEDVSFYLAGSTKKLWWVCKQGHEWTSPIQEMCKGRDCAACARRVASPEWNLLTEFPQLARELHSTLNTLTARELHPGSTRKVWWKCSICNNVYQSTTATRTRFFVPNAGCKKCRRIGTSKMERKIAIEISAQFQVDSNSLQHQQLEFDRELVLQSNKRWKCGFRPRDFRPDFVLPEQCFGHSVALDYDPHDTHVDPTIVSRDHCKSEIFAASDYVFIRLREIGLPKISETDFEMPKYMTLYRFTDEEWVGLARDIVNHIRNVIYLESLY